MFVCNRKYSSCSTLVVLVSLGLGLTGCGGGGGGGGNDTGSTSAGDWTAARETPYQGSRLSATG